MWAHSQATVLISCRCSNSIKDRYPSAVNNITKVQLRADNGDWMDANGNTGWTFVLDTSKLKNGKHTLQARAFDGTDYSDLANRTIKVDNPKQAQKGFIPMMDGGWRWPCWPWLAPSYS